MSRLFKETKKSFLIFAAAVIIAAVTGCNSAKIDKKGHELEMNPAVVTGTLDNGINYYVLKNSEPKNRILLRLVVKAGSCMEEDDQKGVAHFIEHLAFNGTENFEKNSIIDFFELIGMDFGADLNAYTSFDETVYQLEIPADDPEVLKQALLIFHDWACAVSFDAEEIEKERGVVTEEWRSRRGLNGRVSDAIVDFFLDGSRYEDRMPIGDMDVIKNIPRERILDFYEEWYRPELMSVVVVGDAESDVLESAVKEAMEVIPASKKKISSPRFDVPVRTEKAIYTMRDPEQVTAISEILIQEEDFEPRHTVEQFKIRLINEIIGEIINLRLNEITMSADAPWLGANVTGIGYTNYSNFNGLAFVAKDGMYESALKTILDEVDRMSIFGITESELSRTKDAVIAEAEQRYSARETIRSGSIINSIVSQIVCGKTYLSEETLYNTYQSVLAEITVDDVNAAVRKMFGERGMVYFTLAGENSDILSDEQIMDIWKNYKSEAELEAYVDDVPDGELMVRPAKKAAIKSVTKIDELGATEYVLENGLKFYTKVTDFEKNAIRVSGISKGGSALVADEDIPSLQYAAMYTILSGIGPMDYTQFVKALSSTNISLSLNVDDHQERFSGSGPEKDMETLLQIVSLVMTKPNFTEAGWNQVILQANNSAQSYGVSPEDVFSEKITQIIHGKQLRYSMVSPEFVSKINRERAEVLFKERFSNAADFAFTFVGDFDEQNIVDLCCYYLGNLPGDENAVEETKYEDFKFPKGITKETVVKGVENKGKVYIGFGGTLSAASDVNEIWRDIEMMEQFRSLADIKLREVIREDKGGTYGVSVYADIDGFPERTFTFEISFGCEPEREEELAEEVINVLKSLKTELVSQTYIDKLTETYRRTFEVNQRNNYYWLNTINATKVLTYEPLSVAADVESVPSWTTPEELKKLANKYINTDNYICAFLKPELK